MKVLLDEDSMGLKEYLEHLLKDYEIITVKDVGLDQKSDNLVRDYAEKHDCILVTKDWKSGDVAITIGLNCVPINDSFLAPMVAKQIRNLAKGNIKKP